MEHSKVRTESFTVKSWGFLTHCDGYICALYHLECLLVKNTNKGGGKNNIVQKSKQGWVRVIR